MVATTILFALGILWLIAWEKQWKLPMPYIFFSVLGIIIFLIVYGGLTGKEPFDTISMILGQGI